MSANSPARVDAWLHEYLTARGGSAPQAEIVAAAAAELRVSLQTLRRSKTRLGVKADHPEPALGCVVWTWRMPLPNAINFGDPHALSLEVVALRQKLREDAWKDAAIIEYAYYAERQEVVPRDQADRLAALRRGEASV